MNALDVGLRVAVGLLAMVLVVVVWTGTFIWGLWISEKTGKDRYMGFGILWLLAPPVLGVAHGLGIMILGG